MSVKSLFSGSLVLTLVLVGLLRSTSFGDESHGETNRLAPVRPLYPNTTLVCGDKAAATIVYPSKVAGRQEMAERISAAMKAKTGVVLPILPDVDVTEKNHPVLLDEYRKRNLILLGRLGTNRAIWGVYNRFLCAVDGYYPGGDGYVVRTASNVYNTGANTIIAGGSNEKGAARAVDKLIEIIKAQPVTDDTLTLPWLLDVELGGECKEVVDADEKRQTNRGFQIKEGHENNPYRRFYENVMSYYWTGRKSYLDIGLKYLDHVLGLCAAMQPDKRHLGTHYSGEFFVRAYDMIDDSGILSGELARAVDQGLVDTYRNHFIDRGRDYIYLESYRKRIEEGAFDRIWIDTHQNKSWLANKTLADFILTKIPETSENAFVLAAARERRDTLVKLFDALIAERWRGCSNNTTLATVATLFRHALEMERYDEFFDSGNALLAATQRLARTDNLGRDIGLPRGQLYTWSEFGLLLGIVASYYRDGNFKAVLDVKPGRLDGHYGSYILRIHTYRPGPELPAVEPKSLIGAKSIPTQPLHYRRRKTNYREAASTTVPYGETFDDATIRGGFGDEDDYLLLSGGEDLPANAIVRLLSKGHWWLKHSFSMNNFDQNALYITRSSKRDLKNEPVPPLARLDCVETTKTASLISSTLPDYSGTDWNRRIIWLPGKCFVVLDEVAARETGDYLVMANWRPNLDIVGSKSGGAARLDPDGHGEVVVRKGDLEFVMKFSGAGTRLAEDLEMEEPVKRETTPVYRQSLTTSLAQGERATLANVMFTRPTDSAKDYDLRWTRTGGLLIRATGDHNDVVFAGPMPMALGESDASTVVLTPDELVAFDVGRLLVGDVVVANGDFRKARKVGFLDDRAQAVLNTLWEAGTSHCPTIGGENSVNPSAELRPEWRYEGARRPGLIGGVRQIESNLWDLGHVADLTKIAAMTTGELSWAERSKGAALSGKLPEKILTSVDGKEGTFEPFEGEVTDIDVPVMVNYGRVEKNEDVFQVVEATPRKARFVKVVADPPLAAKSLLFYDAAKSDERQDPLRTSVIRSKDKANPDILVSPNIWSGFRKVRRLEHEIVVLNDKGEERWRRSFDWRIFFVRLLDWDGDGTDEIFVGSLDNAIRVYDADGRLVATLSDEGLYSYEDGGHPLAINAGLWLPDETGRREIVTSRYCYVSFLNRDGKLKGHIRPGIYWITDLLSEGIDVTGDGLEDQLAMTSSQIFFLDSTSETRACLQRFPPVWYGENASSPIDPLCGTVKLPSGPSSSLSGSPTLAFSLFGKDKAKLFVARENMIGVLDLKTRKWTTSWIPETPIAAAVALPDQRQILCATREGILWRIKLDDNDAVANIETAPVTIRFNRFAVLERKKGTVTAASDQGVFKINPDNSIEPLVPGSFIDVTVYPSAEGPEKLVVVDETNVVEEYQL